jgi:hypothetical protein
MYPKEVMPLRGFPKGRTKIVMRSGHAMRVYVKSSDGIRVFLAKQEKGTWIPAFEEGANIRAN